MRGSLYREGVGRRIGGSGFRNRDFARGLGGSLFGLGGGAGVLAGFALTVLLDISLELGLVGKILLLLARSGLFELRPFAGLLLRGLGGGLLGVAGVEGIPAGLAGSYALGAFTLRFGTFLRTDFGLGEGLSGEGIGTGQAVGERQGISGKGVQGGAEGVRRGEAVGQCRQ